MYLKKLCGGVLHIQTANGLRCVELTGRERLSLMWLFRNFKLLPEAVLNGSARTLLQSLLGSDRSQLRCTNNHADDDDFVIGTIECVAAPKKTAASPSKRPATAKLVPDAPGLSTRAVS
ncbi:MAG TPA: hypothetical protein VG897_15535 [Terriglobales bacterium]|nr:hypothetical protein [Terriglobales bacterium]